MTHELSQALELSQAETDDIAKEITCPVLRSILDRIGDRWSVLVLLQLRLGPKRFNEMHRDLTGISRRMLTFTLRNLERDGLVNRRVHPTVPPQVEYSQTPLALDLRHTMEALTRWALRNRAPVMKARAAYDEREAEKNQASEKAEPRNDAPLRPTTVAGALVRAPGAPGVAGAPVSGTRHVVAGR